MQNEKKLLIDTKEWYQSIKNIERNTEKKSWCKLNFFWSTQNYDLMTSILNDSKTAQDAIKNIAKTELFSINADSLNPLYDAKKDTNKINQYAVDWHINLLSSMGIDLSTLPDQLDEPSYFSNQKLQYKGRRVSPDFFRLLHAALLVQKYLKNAAAPKILELGAGTGELARFVNSLLPISQYIICDIPETLCFSYIFLNLFFPDDNMLLVNSPEDLASEKFNQAKFVFVPTIYADRLKVLNVDMFVNVASLGEMKNAAIRFWFDLIQNFINPTYMLSINRYLNTIIPNQHYWRFEENECSVLYDKKWNMLSWEVEPHYTRCPYVIQRHARYLHIVAERLSAVDQITLDKRSDRLYDEVINSDEFKFADVDVTMTHRDNSLVNDLTKQGIIFKLWESIRLNANINNVWALIKKLDRLVTQKDKIFEETVYYEKLLLKLLDKTAAKENNELKTLIQQRVTNHENKAYLKNKQPVLLGSFHCHNIVEYNKIIFGIPQNLGEINLNEIDISDYSNVLLAKDVDTIRNKIKKSLFDKTLFGKFIGIWEKKNITTFHAQPKLLKDFKNYNIVGYKKRFLGVPQQLGKIDLTLIDINNEVEIFQADTLSEVKKKIKLLHKKKHTPMRYRSKYLNKLKRLF